MSGRQEHPDPVPVEWPLHLKRPPTLAEEIQRLVRIEVSRVAEAAGLETFEESDDFDIDDDDMPRSPHELSDLEESVPREELTRREQERIKEARDKSRRKEVEDAERKSVDERGLSKAGEVHSRDPGGDGKARGKDSVARDEGRGGGGVEGSEGA